MVGSIPEQWSIILDGRYRLERVLGEGAFGRVYVAFDTRLQRTVAVKELSATKTSSDPRVFEQYLDRFAREARAAGSVFHPHIVNVFELAIDPHNNHYLVMEYIDGGNLRDLLQQTNTVSVERALRITLEIARALDAIHEIDIVHRDLKPANIMLTRRGEAKLADFGIAQLSHESMRTQVTTGHPGTPLYMSPEQRQNTDYLDGRSDLYSLGLILYEMLAGEPYARRKRPLEQLRSDVPDAVVRIVRKLTERDAEGRYQTAEDVIADLQVLLTVKPPHDHHIAEPYVDAGVETQEASAPTEIATHEVANASAETAAATWELAPGTARWAGTGTKHLDTHPVASEASRRARTRWYGRLGVIGAMVVVLSLIGGWIIIQGGKHTGTSPTASPSTTVVGIQGSSPSEDTSTPSPVSGIAATNTGIPPTATVMPPATQVPPTNTPTSSPTPRASATTRPDFQMVVNQQYGFSFAYPRAWQRSDDQTDQETPYGFRMSPSAVFLVVKEDTTFTTLDAYIDDEIMKVTKAYPDRKPGPRMRQATTIDGQEARIADFVSTTSTGQNYHYYIHVLRQKSVWSLVFITPMNDFGTFQRDIDDVVRSFVFCPGGTCPSQESAPATSRSARIPYLTPGVMTAAILGRRIPA